MDLNEKKRFRRGGLDHNQEIRTVMLDRFLSGALRPCIRLALGRSRHFCVASQQLLPTRSEVPAYPRFLRAGINMNHLNNNV